MVSDDASEPLSRPVRVLLADDHDLVRAGVRSLLDRMGHVEVVGEAGTGREALSLVATCDPDVLLLDIAMSELNGLEAAERVRDEFPRVRVVILSMHANEEYVARAFAAGAAGYLLKNAAAAELGIAIDAAVRGDAYLSPAISRLVVKAYTGHTASAAGPLTNRQREVLRCLALGYSTRKTASELGISVKTVETHRAQMMERLGVHDLPGLVRYAIRAGLTPPD
jgi:DNA-binding NarL/FixJ family response regulator